MPKAASSRAICGKPVAGSTCSLLKHHKGRCVRPVGRAVKPAEQDNRGELPATANLTPEQVGEVLERAAGFMDWLAAVKVHALELMQKGHHVPGMKAVAKNTRYAWNKNLTPAQIAKALGLKPADIQEMKLKSPSKVKKMLKAGDQAKVGKLTWRPFEVTLAPESDRRTAIPSTKISFEPVHRGEEEED